ncbi:MAG: hypothetical protein M0Z33_09155 [Actinomycetota bacterium]|nr:hypothetical protein [Actinomycetota bacterium]
MRVLVVGTTPPPGGASARRLAGVVADLVAGGHEVQTLSPDSRSASHSHAVLAGPMLAFQLAWRARDFDAVVLCLERDMPLAPDANRVLRSATLALLGVALRGYEQVTLRVASPVPIPWGVGGRATREMWSRATSVVLASSEDVDQVLEAPGVTAEKLTVEAPTRPEEPGREPGWRGVTGSETDLRETVQAAVRARASRTRNLRAARAALGVPPPVRIAVDPFTAGPPTRRSVDAAELAQLALFALGFARHLLSRVRAFLRGGPGR